MKINALKQLVVTIAITLLFTFSSVTAQTHNKEINDKKFDAISNMVANALSNSNIKIAVCKNTGNYIYSATEDGVTRQSLDPFEFYHIILAAELARTASVLIELRGDIDSLIFIRSMDKTGNPYVPTVKIIPGSEWILFLESPFNNSRLGNAKLLERIDQVNGGVLLNSGNFFNLYDYCYGGVCIDWPEEEDILLQPLIFSDELIDDFKTIIKLKENPSLLSESADSYDTYYSSMKDELGKRVFSRLFDNPNQE